MKGHEDEEHRLTRQESHQLRVRSEWPGRKTTFTVAEMMTVVLIIQEE